MTLVQNVPKYNQLQHLLHTTAIHVPEKMSFNLHIYAIFHAHIWGCICMDVPYVKSLASIISSEGLYIYFTNYISYYCYIFLNKYGCHIENKVHSDIILVLHIDPLLAHTCTKPQPTVISTSVHCHICTSNEYAHQSAHICHIFDIFD